MRLRQLLKLQPVELLLRRRHSRQVLTQLWPTHLQLPSAQQNPAKVWVGKGALLRGCWGSATHGSDNSIFIRLK